MEWYFALGILLGAVLFSMRMGLPVAFAFFGAKILGTAMFINAGSLVFSQALSNSGASADSSA